ncbi:MAG: 3-isopropylmalate dehydratase small subunit [Thermoplasmata archaeon]
MIVEGRVWKFGDNINTDLIYPSKYLTIAEPTEMAKHAMENADAKFSENVSVGDIIVAGRNFGCGSSREQAAVCLKYTGISAIIAESFARIFYRNAINLGIPILVCPNISKIVRVGDLLQVDFENGVVRNKKRRKSIKTDPLPSFLIDIIKDGGLVPNLRKRVLEHRNKR